MPVQSAGPGGSSGALEGGSAEKRRFTLVFPLLLAVGITPLWIVTYLPMTDLPQHLALINILHNLNDPAMRFHEFFTIRKELTPYLGYYWTVHFLAYLVPLEIANRIFLSACVAGLAGAGLWLASALDRSRWVALFSLPLAYSYLFYVGFINSMAGQSLLVAALAAYASRLRGGIRGRLWDLVLVALPLACLATHVQPFSFFLAALAVMIAAFPGHRLSALVCSAPSLLLFSWWLLRLIGGDPSGVAGPKYLVFEPLAARFSGFHEAVLDQFRGHLDTTFSFLFAALWVWALVAAIRSPTRITWRARAGPWWVAPVLSAGALGGYFVMPSHSHMMQFINARYAPLACLLLVVSVPLSRGAAPRTWRYALIALCTASSIYVGVQFLRFDREAGDFCALADKVERDACVATISGYMKSGVMIGTGLYNHFAGYISLWRGALPGYTLAGMPHQPLAYRRADGSQASGYIDAAFPVILEHEPPRYILRGELYQAYGGYYRYFLAPRSRDIRQFFGSQASHLAKLGESGPLALYENPQAQCGRLAP